MGKRAIGKAASWRVRIAGGACIAPSWTGR
jgi:hypothetical protein